DGVGPGAGGSARRPPRGRLAGIRGLPPRKRGYPAALRYLARTAAPACSADRSAKSAGGPPAGNSRSPEPRIAGKVSSRYSSIRSLAISVCTMLRLPVTITSRRWRLTASMRSPSTACEFAHAEVPVRVRVTTSFGTAFIRAENGWSRRGQIGENSSQVLRPSSRTPSSSTLPSRNLSPATAAGPCRNAHPPAGVPPDPSGSVTIPSTVMNSMTTTLTMVPFGRCSPVHTGDITGTHRGRGPPRGPDVPRRRAGWPGPKLKAPAYPATARYPVSLGDRDLLLVEGDIAAVVLADAVERRRVRVRVTPRCVVMGGTTHGDVVILGDALPRAGIRRRAVTEHAGTDRGGREVVVALDRDQVGLGSVRHNRVIDDGLHVPFPSGCRKIPLRQLRAGRVTSRPARRAA